MLQLTPKSIFNALNLSKVQDAATRDVFLQVSKLLTNSYITIAKVVNDISTKAATLLSPTFTGTVTMPDNSTFSTLFTAANGAVATTQTASDNTTKIATTAFVQAAINAQFPLSIANGGTGSGTVAGALNNLNAIINNTGAGADITLAVGQAAYVDYTTATSVALHITTGDNQIYELLIFNSTAGNSGTATALNPNNTTFANAMTATFMGDSAQAQTNGNITVSTMDICQWALVTGRINISTKTTQKFTINESRGNNATGGTTIESSVTIWNDTTTAWTSIGTLSFATSTTGRAYIKRLM